MERDANLIGDWVDDAVVGNFRGGASLKRTDNENPEFRVTWRTNVQPPYTFQLRKDGPDGEVLYEWQVEDAGRQEETADENNYQGSGPAEIFADGFESGDTTAWSSVVGGGTAKGAEATPIIAGPFR